MSLVEPVKVGVLFDYKREPKEGQVDTAGDFLKAFNLVIEEFSAAGKLDRPVELVVRHVNGLPRGSFRAVRDAYHELVEEDCMILFGPLVSENAAPLREYVDAARVPCVAMAATESLYSEYCFGLPNGSMEEEPIILANIAYLDGVRSVGVCYDDSLIGHEYLRTMRAACAEQGIEIKIELALPQVEWGKEEQMRILQKADPDALMMLSFGLANVGINDALKEIGWTPPRYTTTSFNFGMTATFWRKQLAGWIGLDSYDERNLIGRAFLDRFEKRYDYRPEYFYPLFAHDAAQMIITAISTARPLTPVGVKQALERIKMMPAASGAPGTRMRFGKFLRHGWVGEEFLVVRRYTEDAKDSVLHGTINGHCSAG